MSSHSINAQRQLGTPESLPRVPVTQFPSSIQQIPAQQAADGQLLEMHLKFNQV